MKKTLWLLLITPIALFTSCGFHSGMMTSNASLSGDNFEIVDIVTARASAKKYFFIGGIDKTALVLEAKRKLYENVPLKKGQAFANVSVDFHRSVIFFVDKTTVTVSADLVQFGEQADRSYQTLFELMDTDAGSANSPVKEGQVVYFKVGSLIKEGTVKVILKNIVMIKDIDPNSSETYNIIHKYVFEKVEDGDSFLSKAYNLDEEVIFFEDEQRLKGKIVGWNKNYLVLENDGRLYARSPSDIITE